MVHVFGVLRFSLYWVFFSSVFVRKIGLKFSFLIESLCGLSIRVTVASENEFGSIPSVSILWSHSFSFRAQFQCQSHRTWAHTSSLNTEELRGSPTGCPCDKPVFLLHSRSSYLCLSTTWLQKYQLAPVSSHSKALRWPLFMDAIQSRRKNSLVCCPDIVSTHKT